MMTRAIKQAAATDNTIIPITRFDLNISNGIAYTIKEFSITDIIIGLHHLADEEHAFLGPITEKILEKTNETVFIYKSQQPINTLKRIIVAIPNNAEYEKGFQHLFNRIINIARETGLPLLIYSTVKTAKVLWELNENNGFAINISYSNFEDWSDFLIFSREVKRDDLFIIIASRRGYLSYTPNFEKLPKYLTKYFADDSYIIVYPKQIENLSDSDLKPFKENAEVLSKAGDFVKSIFNKKEI
jgi:hypothetical protein